MKSEAELKADVRLFFEQDTELAGDLESRGLQNTIERFLVTLTACRKEIQAHANSRGTMAYYFETSDLAKARRDCTDIGVVAAVLLLKEWAESD